MGVKTLYEYFYKLAYGDKGADKATLVSDCLDVADAEIKANKDAKHTQNTDTDLDATFEATIAKKADKLSAFAITTSEELASIISDAIGSGKLVFGISPLLTAPHLVNLSTDYSNVVLRPYEEGKATEISFTHDVAGTEKFIKIAGHGNLIGSGLYSIKKMAIYTKGADSENFKRFDLEADVNSANALWSNIDTFQIKGTSNYAQLIVGYPQPPIYDNEWHSDKQTIDRITATTISFTHNEGSADTINDSASGFTFTAGDFIMTSSTSGLNDYDLYEIATATANVLTLVDDADNVVETESAVAAGTVVVSEIVGMPTETAVFRNDVAGTASGLRLINMNGANNDAMVLSFAFKNSNGYELTGAQIKALATDLTAGSSDVSLNFYVRNAGASLLGLTLSSTGSLDIPRGQIAFPATPNPSAGANVLDDYKEGEWTATLVCGTSGTITLSASYNTGAYVKIGRMVVVTGDFLVDSVSSPVGNLTLNTLPFACGNTDKFNSGISIYADGLEATATPQIMGSIFKNTTGIRLVRFAAGAIANMAADIKAGSTFRISATYFTD